jgi:hypothetical protein
VLWLGAKRNRIDRHIERRGAYQGHIPCREILQMVNAAVTFIDLGVNKESEEEKERGKRIRDEEKDK